MLKSWRKSPVHKAIAATQSASAIPIGARINAADIGSLPRERAENDTGTVQAEARMAMQRANGPRSVIGLSGRAGEQRLACFSFLSSGSYRAPHLASTAVGWKTPSGPSLP